MANVLKRPESDLPPSDLYEADFFAWTQDQAEKLRARSLNGIDWDNLAEEIDSVGRSERKEIHSRLEKLLMHLLKWQFQPEKRCASWQSTISEQRTRIRLAIDYSPSLKSHPGAVIDKAFGWARKKAAEETGLAIAGFPELCPWPVEDVLDEVFMPGVSWSPDDLIYD